MLKRDKDAFQEKFGDFPETFLEIIISKVNDRYKTPQDRGEVFISLGLSLIGTAMCSLKQEHRNEFIDTMMNILRRDQHE